MEYMSLNRNDSFGKSEIIMKILNYFKVTCKLSVKDDFANIGKDCNYQHLNLVLTK